MKSVIENVWVFNGAGSRFPGGIFSSRDTAENWIRNHKLSGVLTLYPFDQGVYDWVIENKIFEPKKESESSPDFIGSFSSASQEHYHYLEGTLDG